MFSAIIFDLDGTLIDSMNIWHECDTHFLKRRGIALPPDLFDNLTSNNINDLAVYFKERFALPDSIDDIINEWIAFVSHAYENTIAMKPFAIEILQYLNEAGYTLALGTSNERSLAQGILQRYNLLDYFKTIVVGCDCQNGKPAPDIFLLIANNLQVDPQDCLVIEDSLLGVQAAKNAGMTVYAVADDAAKPDRQAILQTADCNFENLQELYSSLLTPHS